MSAQTHACPTCGAARRRRGANSGHAAWKSSAGFLSKNFFFFFFQVKTCESWARRAGYLQRARGGGRLPNRSFAACSCRTFQQPRGPAASPAPAALPHPTCASSPLPRGARRRVAARGALERFRDACQARERATPARSGRNF